MPFTAKNTDLLVCLQPEGTGVPFFCIHPVGGTVFCYKELARCLGPKRPVYAFQAQGIGGEEKPLTSIPEIACSYVKVMQELQPHGPYYIGGWSVGGVIALEMALQLQSRGTSTAVLALIDSYLPRASVLHGKSGNGQEHVAQLLAFAHDLGISPVRFAINEQLLKSLEQTTIMEIVQQAKQLGSLPLDFDGAVAQHLFEVFKANYAAVWKYIPSPYQGKITYFLAQNGASKAPAAVTVWNSLARAGMDWHVVPADHYTILNKANSELIAKKLTRCIAEVESGLTSHNL